MSIYVLAVYIEECLEKGLEPSWDGLHEFKKLNWRE